MSQQITIQYTGINQATITIPQNLTEKTINQTIQELENKLKIKKETRLTLRDITTYIKTDLSIILETIKTRNLVKIQFYIEDQLLSISYIQLDGDIIFKITPVGIKHWRIKLNDIHTLTLKNLMANYQNTLTLTQKILTTIPKWRNRINLTAILLNAAIITLPQAPGDT